MDPMTDPRDGAADRPVRDPPAEVLEPLGAPAAESLLPESGQRWRQYELIDQIRGGPGRCFHAIDKDKHVEVLIRVTPVGPAIEARRAAWTVLENLNQPGMVGLIEAREEQGLRYEVSLIPPPLTLRDWAARRTVSLPDFEALVRQLAVLVQALHERGVVHLNLRPDTVYAVSAEGELQLRLGGLELATLFEQPEPFAVAVDLLYAPPEAVGMEMQPPGRALCAWDWWSVGRVVQEFVLGKHIYSELLQRDVSQEVAAFHSEAEDLLNELGGYQVRAGAVELMPAMYDEQISLLRGLLTSVRIGRWGYRQVQQWLEHRPVKDRYDNPRDERFFVRPDGVFTVMEVAEYFSQEANWPEGEANLFNPDDPATFAHFIASEPGNYDLDARLKSLFDLGGIPEWRDLPETARRTALAGIAWASLAGPKTGLRVRGLRVTHHELLALVRGEGDLPALGCALLAPLYLQALQQADPETASSLSEVAGQHSAVLAAAVTNGWVEAGDPAASCQLLAWCLESPNALVAALHRLRARYVRTRNPAAEALVAAVASDRKAQILLAYADSCPERFGFVSQETLNRERCDQLTQEGRRVAAALFWLRLRVVLESNPFVFGSWVALAASWLGLAAFAWFTGLHRERMGGIVLLLAIPPVMRLVHWAGLRRLLVAHAPGARQWLWRDGRARCLEDMAAVLPGSLELSEEKIARQLVELNWKIAEIPLQQPTGMVPVPSRLPALWITSIAGWLILVFVFGGAAVAGINRVRAGHWRFARILNGLSLPPAAENHGGGFRPPNADWSFGDPRRVRIGWDLPKPAAVPLLAVEKTLVATPDQVAFALVEGERELMPYRRGTVQALIAVRVPTPAGVGFVLFESQEGTVAERRVYLVGSLPSPRSWFALNQNQVAYLGPSKPEVAAGRAEPADPEPSVP
jgi:serine/threonine protein kinase